MVVTLMVMEAEALGGVMLVTAAVMMVLRVELGQMTRET